MWLFQSSCQLRGWGHRANSGYPNLPPRIFCSPCLNIWPRSFVITDAEAIYPLFSAKLTRKEREASEDMHAITRTPPYLRPGRKQGGRVYCDSRPAAGRMSRNKGGGYCADILWWSGYPLMFTNSSANIPSFPQNSFVLKWWNIFKPDIWKSQKRRRRLKAQAEAEAQTQ